MALASGVDVLGSLTSVLVKMGERFTEEGSKVRLSPWMLRPSVLSRFIRASSRAREEGRPMLPRDLWPLKGLICYGMDTRIYRDRVVRYWGRPPLEGYAATETGGLATQAWNKRFMTFVPSSVFYEFIPESEWEKSRNDVSYQPRTVLMDELEVGKRYEVVVTSFHGMPFFRYRLGDMLTVEALEDDEAGIALPQFSFACRADDLIDIGGFTRLDEQSVWQVASAARPEQVEELIKTALSGDFHGAREQLDHFLVELGLSGEDVLLQIYRSVSELSVSDKLKAELIDHIGEIDFRMSEGANERIQLDALLAYFASVGGEGEQ